MNALYLVPSSRSRVRITSANREQSPRLPGEKLPGAGELLCANPRDRETSWTNCQAAQPAMEPCTLPFRQEEELNRSSLSCGINEWFAHWSSYRSKCSTDAHIINIAPFTQPYHSHLFKKTNTSVPTCFPQPDHRTPQALGTYPGY